MDEERVEGLEVEQEAGPKPTEIRYVFARFHRRVLANLIDFLLWGFLFLGFFLGIRAIVINSPNYVANEEELISIRIDSGLYQRTVERKVFDIVSFLELEENGFSGFSKQTQAKEAIDTFIAYVDEKAGQEASAKVQSDYDSYRLSSNLTYQGVSYFIKSEGEIIKNEACTAFSST